MMNRREIMLQLFGYISDEEEEDAYKPKSDNEGKVETEGNSEVGGGDPKGVPHDHLGSSRLPGRNDKGKAPQVLGDSHGDQQSSDHAVYKQKQRPANEKEHSRDDKESKVEGIGEDDANLVVFEIPFRRPPANQDQMATIKLSSIIGIDPKPFDPATFVEEKYYVTDETGSKRLVPPANIIRWREIKNPDGTTSSESNARFVTWEDGSMQLLIGKQAFDVSEQEAQKIQSQLFVGHKKGIYQSQGRISRNLKLIPTSLSSYTHHSLASRVDSRRTMSKKVRHCVTDVAPERLVEINKKVERQTTKANTQLNEKKKKVIDKYRPKGGKDHRLTTRFLEDAIVKDNKQNKEPQLDFSDLDLEKEAAAEKRIIQAKKGLKTPHGSASSSLKLTKGPLRQSEDENVEVEKGSKGNKIEVSKSPDEVEAEGSERNIKKLGRRLRKKYIKSDEV